MHLECGHVNSLGEISLMSWIILSSLVTLIVKIDDSQHLFKFYSEKYVELFNE